MIFHRWCFYSDIPVGFGRQVVFDLGWMDGDWIGCVGWRWA